MGDWLVPAEEQSVEFRQWIAASEAARRTRTSTGDAWPEPESLGDGTPPVLPFNEAMLPGWLRGLVEDTAERMQVPLDLPAAAAIVALAGAVGRRAVVQPKRADSSWAVPGNLWGGVVAPPGYLKSPVLESILKPLLRIERDYWAEFEDAKRAHEIAIEERDLRLAAWKDGFRRALRKGEAPPPRPDEQPDEPAPKRLIVNDATTEALHSVLAANPAGVLVVRDELTGWLASLDRQGREGERAFYLECWNGSNSFTIDRIGRGCIRVEHACVSLIGGIQPARLRSYLEEAVQDGPGNDGLVQRLQVLVWPDLPRDWHYIDRPPRADLQAQAEAAMRRLVDLDPAEPVRFRFEDDAQELFVAWLSELESKIRSGDLHPALVSHLAKYRRLMPTLAMLLELAEAAEEGFVGFVGFVDRRAQTIKLEQARRAAALCSYLESHARRMYSCVVSPQIVAAKELARRIKERRLGDSFSIRDIYLKGWNGLDSPERARIAVEVLEEMGWLRRAISETGPQGGRPSSRFIVNPKIWGDKQ